VGVDWLGLALVGHCLLRIGHDFAVFYIKNRAKAIKELRAAEKSLWLKRFVTT